MTPHADPSDATLRTTLEAIQTSAALAASGILCIIDRAPLKFRDSAGIGVTQAVVGMALQRIATDTANGNDPRDTLSAVRDALTGLDVELSRVNAGILQRLGVTS